MEIEVIKLIGRLINNGSLTNLTDGGDNPPVSYGDQNPMRREEIKDKFRGINNPNYGKKGFDNHRSKPVAVYNLNNELIEIIGSMRQSQVKYGYEFGSIVKNCQGKTNRVGNHKFKYYKNGDN